MIHDSSASNTGTAMMLVIGKFTPGVISMTLRMSTQKNIVDRNGNQLAPSGPSTGITICPRTKSTATSATFCAPFGTSFGARKARQKK